MGLVNKRRIPDFKRTQNFTVCDFDTLANLLDWFGKLFTTPHVLSQVGDVTDKGGRELATARKHFGFLVEKLEEHYDASTDLVTDLSSSDLDLQLALQHRGLEALNFNHVRLLG